MIQMLENESGIELRIPETDKGWRELAYLNAKINVGRMSKAQMVYMRQRQKKWIGAMLMACLFLSLHRKYGFGKDRLVRLMGQIHEIEAEYNSCNCFSRFSIIKILSESDGGAEPPLEWC